MNNEQNNENSYEVLYNIGCAYLSLGDLDQAEVYFRRSHLLVDKLLEEGGIEQNDLFELSAPIDIQVSLLILTI